jgi:hypothetical protein
MPIDYGSNNVSTSGNFVASSGNFTTGLTFNNAPVVKSDTTGITGADQITNIVSLTQAEYDAVDPKNSSTLYVITD